MRWYADAAMVDRLDSSTAASVSSAPQTTCCVAASRVNSCQKISTTPQTPATPPKATRPDMRTPSKALASTRPISGDAA